MEKVQLHFVYVAIVLEAAMFSAQWILQVLNLGGLMRDTIVIGSSLALLAWLSWALVRTGKQSKLMASTAVALAAVWVWGYLLLPMARTCVEVLLGYLPAAVFLDAIVGTALSFLWFSFLPLLIAGLASGVAHLGTRDSRKSS